MNEIEISLSLESPQEKGSTIIISANCKENERLLYKFSIGSGGVWDTLRDFSVENILTWIPDKEGKYNIMVQAKSENSEKAFDYVSRVDYIIGQAEEKLITSVNLEKNILNVGDKLKLMVESSKIPVVYKYWLKEKESWEIIKDYSAENTLSLSVKTPGKHELMIECRALDSKNNFDDVQKVSFEVVPIQKLEINDFRCLTSELLVDNELIFQVETSHEDNRMVLYKFIKINHEGVASCVQDYSTKRMVSFIETEAGDYKLLCFAKDMYSPKEYDDRALISYCVRPYNPIVIQSYTTDLSSPQINETPIELRAVVKGGKDLLYRFIVDGNSSEDSGYVKDPIYIWNAKTAGNYKLVLLVKDASYEGKYEVKTSIPFTIDEITRNPVKIQDVLLDRDSNYVINETINVKAIAVGGVELRYSFAVYKAGEQKEKVEFGNCNWVNFTPEESGEYELEIKVKDKYTRGECDCRTVLKFEVEEFTPARIDYILLPSKENYMVGDNIGFDIIAQRTKDTLIKYVLRINGHKVEESDFVINKKYSFTPKCAGIYVVELFAKNAMSTAEFDSKKEVKVAVNDALPVTNTKIQCDRVNLVVNEAAIFSVKSEGGKDVNYEFYLMEKGEWNLVQRFSKKNYYSFMPFTRGTSKILALSKSEYKKHSYEDYDIMEFEVE